MPNIPLNAFIGHIIFILYFILFIGTDMPWKHLRNGNDQNLTINQWQSNFRSYFLIFCVCENTTCAQYLNSPVKSKGNVIIWRTNYFYNVLLWCRWTTYQLYIHSESMFNDEQYSCVVLEMLHKLNNRIEI